MSVIALDLGGTKIKIGVVEHDTLHGETTKPVDPNQTFSEQMNDLVPVIRETCKQSNQRTDECEGIGISFPGIVNRETTSVESTNKKYEGATRFDLNRWAQDQFDLPVLLENDARAALLGEWIHGAGRKDQNMVMVTIGTGFGSSAMIQGKLLDGSHHQAGILGGHISIRANGYECTCGNVGCIETETGEWNLPRIIREHDRFEQSELSNVSDLTYKTLTDVARNGDPLAEQILEERIKYMGHGIVNVIHAYDPETVVIGGGVMNSGDLILPGIRRVVRNRAWTKWGTVDIRATDYPNYAALFGLDVLFHHEIETI